ncbi:MAG TPA: hypothetical protein VFA09_08260 [Ktedonobacteraceae bacterium]|jgi:hypothetical protein|nr:hypothetical protein [Ktedonobacteraceae bacterium]
MTMIVGSKVLGVLTESQQLDQAIDELQRSGFNNIDFAHPGETASSFNARSGLTGFIRAVFSPNEGDIRGNIVSDLTKIGVPDEEARNYQREFELGRSIIIVDAPGRQEQALAILRQHGAFDPATRSANG